MSDIKWMPNKRARQSREPAPVTFLGREEGSRAVQFLRTIREYGQTPLVSLPHLAEHLGVAGIYVKDEAHRFGLNAFKAIGGAYAIGRYLAERLGKPIEAVSLQQLQSEEAREQLGEITFITATDGNHGRGVAWAARQLGHKSVVYMPKGSSPVRLENIKAAGAECYITEWNYDECVRFCAREAAQNGWTLVQDTSWEGYEDIPRWIMQGYSAIALEAVEQLQELEADIPTHILLQAGVGSFAGAVQGYFAAAFGSQRPVTVIVEPEKAACFYNSAAAGDGLPRRVGGMMDTIMAGLACGEPNPAAWDILWSQADMFISCPDYVAAKGMRLLGNPLPGDRAIISGESGAVTAGTLSLLLQRSSLAEARAWLGINEHSRVLLINTEGDTDPEHYRSVVWDGRLPSYKD